MAETFFKKLFTLEGKLSVVTGATRGIGASIAIALATAGSDIVLLQRDTVNTKTADQIRALGRNCAIVKCDLGSKENLVGLVDEIAKQHGHIDVLINCGGIQRRHPAEQFPDSDWEEVLQVNLSTVFTLCRDVGKHMLESDRSGRGNGKIINIASLVSFQGGLTVPAYSAAKHGVVGITQSFANEWSPKGINVNAIAPGYIATDMNEALINNETRARQILERIPAQRWGNPDDFMGAVIFLAGQGSNYVCGETLVVDGGWMGR
jgi:2-dehydro-3-deoxy-D-gluconate 5-dehydrogenase